MRRLPIPLFSVLVLSVILALPAAGAERTVDGTWLMTQDLATGVNESVVLTVEIPLAVELLHLDADTEVREFSSFFPTESCCKKIPAGAGLTMKVPFTASNGLGHWTFSADRVRFASYRPDEIPPSSGRHPLERTVDELARYGGGEAFLRRGEKPDRDFVDALVEPVPNDLDARFRDELFGLTEGQPLFTIEMRRSLKSRGILFEGEGGRWSVRGQVTWNELPARAGALVRGQVETLFGPLGRLRHLVAHSGARDFGRRRFTFYRFRHALVRSFLYGRLDEADRLRRDAPRGDRRRDSLRAVESGDPDA